MQTKFNLAERGITSADAMSALTDWLRRRPTHICWLTGPSESGKTASVSNVLAAGAATLKGRCIILPLSAANSDHCLQQLSGDEGRSTNPLTTAQLFELLSDGEAKLLVLDALDMVQQQGVERAGQVTDLRLRLLLSAAASGRWPGLSVVATSRLRPPPNLRSNALVLIELAAREKTEGQSPEPSPHTTLEIIASSRQASSGWLLGLLTGPQETQPSLATPVAVGAVLEEAISLGLVERVGSGGGGEWFQMRDGVRCRFMSTLRAEGIHAAVADGLQSDDVLRRAALIVDDDPALLDNLLERAMYHRVEAGDLQGAVRVYWESLGNFSRLRSLNALHMGVRACGVLNEGLPPRQVSPALKDSGWAIPVINDWGLYAVCTGDVRLAVEAAKAAYGLVDEGLPPWDKSMLARHAAEAIRLSGRLTQATRWAERALEHARDGLRMNEGLPTREVMDAYDEAYHVTMKVAAAAQGAGAVGRVLDDVAELHARVRKKLAEFNRFSVIPISGPTGEVKPEELFHGRLAAIASLVGDRPGDTCRILNSTLAGWSREQSESPEGLVVRTLFLRAQLADGRIQEAREAMAELRRRADDFDDNAARCELALIASELALADQDAGRALALADDGLELAANCCLGLSWIDLLVTRSRALLALGRVEEAKTSAAAALFGPEEVESIKERWPASADMHGALHGECGYRAGIRAAVAAIQAVGGEVPESALAAATAREAEPTQGRRPRPSVNEERATTEAEQRIQLHEAALDVIDAYNTRGLPFAIYFRKYDIDVWHGPFEFGPRLVENVLREAMPPGASVLTIQNHDSNISYGGSKAFFDRSAPALLLEDDQWQEAAAAFIPFADLIVSECLMLSGGVRFELDTAFGMGRWDRTVLVLPPLDSPLAVVDSDPIIQLFPRCIWADEFHSRSLTDSPLVTDLIARMAAIAALPEDERLPLIDRRARDEAFPVDLSPIAHHYEVSALLGSHNQDEDKRVRYYGFWELFRATSIRGVLMMNGDDSFANRSRMADAYIQMSAIMLDNEREGDRIVMVGDLTFAEQCAQSAYNLVRDGDTSLLRDYLRERAEKQFETVMRVRKVVEANPDRFVMRARYGPFPVRAV